MTRAHPHIQVNVKLDTVDDADVIERIREQPSLVSYVRQLVRRDMREQPPYDQLIRILANDWEIEASWDGLRRFWYVGWTDEHVERCKSVTIDQDWVRDLVERYSVGLGGNGRELCNGAYQMMSDEIFAFIHDTATLGRGECEIETTENWLPAERYHRCKECGAFFAVLDASHDIPPRYCPNCGRKVVDPTTNDVDAEVDDGQ